MTPFNLGRFGIFTWWLPCSMLALCCLVAYAAPASDTFYLLEPNLKAGLQSIIEIELKVGGDLLVQENTPSEPPADSSIQKIPATEKLPMSVVAKLRYEEQMLAWSAKDVSRSLRYYDTAQATFKVGAENLKRTMPDSQRLVLTEIRDSLVTMNGLNAPLTRNQIDLLHVVGDTLVLDRLLPGQRLAEGENWNHDAETIGALLGMDNVADCEVSSVISGEAQGQVRILLAGSVHGSIDGAATELDLRGEYLFDQAQKRISRFNLAIKEHRKTGPVTPGLDIVANLTLKVTPKQTLSHLSNKPTGLTKNLAVPINHELLYYSPQNGVRFRHDDHWYITAESRKQLALRRLQGSTLVAHCNITTLPARSTGRQTTLEQFEREIRQALGDHLDEVSAAKEWNTATGHHCLGIFVNGKTKEVPLQWRFYLIATDDMPRVSLTVTIEQAQLDEFADADRLLVDSLQLTGKQVPETASKPGKRK
jgi:hypothetical protein